ncbi:MAG: DUF916 and DUF3324 domain-containing protein [Bacillota bacterium]
MRKMYFLIGLLVFIFIFNNFNLPYVQAAEMNFAVKALIPETQIDKTKTYFDLKMEPGQKQTIQVEMRNDTEKDVVVEVRPNAAVTNDNGVIEYTISDVEYDETLKYPFTELVTVEEEVTVKAKGTYMLDITIQMPKEEYDGVILGGLYFIEKEEKEEEAGSQAVQIKNLYSYVIGVQLSETEAEVEPNMQLIKIEPAQVNYRNYVKATLQNTESTIIRDLNVDAAVYTENGSSILHETNREGLKMAPNSQFGFGINWENQPFKPGTYRLEMTADSGEFQWEWTEYFTIAREKAEDLNKQAVELEKSYLWLWIILGIIGLIILLYLVFLIGRKSNNNSKE